jgi:hypothetical protein
MTLTAREMLYSLYGAYRLARLDKDGVVYFDSTPEGAMRSFHAAVLVLPAYVVLTLLRQWDQLGDLSLVRFLMVEGIAYVISWTAYPLLMFHVSGLLDRADHFYTFLCAYNWSSVIQMAVYLPVVLLAETGLLPPALSEGLVMITTLLILVYQWFVVRTTLDVNPGVAAGLVLVDVTVAVTITSMADGMLQ